MKKLTLLLSLCFFSAISMGEQTIVFMRHGEKPNDKSGVLTCQGLNRSLELPNTLAQFGKPDALFAAAPKQNQLGNSIRSVQTILPTATKNLLPIHLEYHANDVIGIKNALLKKSYENSLIFVAWEHDNLVKIVKEIYKNKGGNPKDIPDWKKEDFDSLYILKLDSKKSPVFIKSAQNLKNLSTACP